MDNVILSADANLLRERWQHADSSNYDVMTGQMCNYLAALDQPLLSLCQGNVLELASGTGRMLSKIRSQPGVKMAVGIDIAAQMLRAAAAKGHNHLTQGCAESLPFADESFDAVVCTFYSFRDIDRPPAYREIARVLRPGGVFGFTLRNFYVAYLETLWLHFISKKRLPNSLITLDGIDGVILDLKDIDQEIAKINQADLNVREIKTLRFLPFLRRFLPVGYWPGRLATKFGSDVIIITEKR